MKLKKFVVLFLILALFRVSSASEPIIKVYLNDDDPITYKLNEINSIFFNNQNSILQLNIFRNNNISTFPLVNIDEIAFRKNDDNSNILQIGANGISSGFAINEIDSIVFNKMDAEFTHEKAESLYRLAFDCIDKEYPNKPGSLLGDDSYLIPPRQMHPSFYGCLDWHSSVHGHWSLIAILKEYPDFHKKDSILIKINRNITEANIKSEIDFFDDEWNKNFERTYGWAWLLKLAETLKDCDTPESQALYSKLQPLEQLLADKLMNFLDLLYYPIRVGEHTNTAFALSLAYDYAQKYNLELAEKIRTKAIEYYLDDKNCPLSWEPSGFDFLSPCLQEASLMLKVLDKEDFELWFDEFLPGFASNPSEFIEPAVVTDASDGKLGHLDGLNFSRAWCLFEIGKALNNEKIINTGIIHFNFSYSKINAGEYMGSHWLASFALYALIANQK